MHDLPERISSYRNESLISGNYSAVIDAYYDTYWKSFSTRYHAHTHIELMYIVKGDCEILVDGSALKFKKNEFILIDSNTFHQLIVDQKGCHIINLEFHFEARTGILPPMAAFFCVSDNIKELFSSSKSFFYLKDMDGISHILQGIISSQRGDADAHLLTHLMFTQLLLKISHTIRDSKKSNYGAYLYVRTAIAYLESHYDSNITIQEIADAVNLHPSYLQKLFRRNMGCTVFDYLCNLRLEKSKVLLTTTDMLITDIPSYIGINSVQYYINLFRRKNNCTPLQYRREHSALYRKDGYVDSFLLP